jgi:uncharacterized membrane protein
MFTIALVLFGGFIVFAVVVVIACFILAGQISRELGE